MVCGPLIQCNLLRNKSLNVFDGGVTSTLYETLGRFIPCNGQNLCETIATAVGESWNLALLSVTVEATCFANVLSVARCVTRLDVS